MAELNFGLLTPPGSESIGNAFVRGQDQALAARQAENANALSQYTLSKARREDELTNQLLGDLRGATTNEEIFRAYQRAGKPDIASKMRSDALTQQKLMGDIAAQPGTAAHVRAQTEALIAKSQSEKTQQAYEDISRLAAIPGGPTDADVMAGVADAVKSGSLSMQRATEVQNHILKAPLEKRSGVLLSMAGSAADRIKALTPHMQLVEKPDGSKAWVDTTPFSPTFGGNAGLPGYAASMTPYQTRAIGVSEGNLNVNRATAADAGIDLSGVGGGALRATPGVPQTPGANRMPDVPQTVAPATAAEVVPTYSPKMLREMAAKGMQPDGKGGQTFIPGGEKDPDAIARIEAAKAQGAATGKDTAAAVRTLPNAIASSQKAISNIDAMLGDARVVGNKITYSKTAPHPGFSDAVGAGIGLRFIPGTEASNFQERFREITSGAFLEAFESLRGGGSITEKEGEKATAAKTRMSLAQSEKEFVTAAREYQNIIRVGVGRAQERLSKAQAVSGGNTGGGGAGSWGKAVAE